MRDPLQGFDWRSLHGRYDDMCKRFDPAAVNLRTITPPPQFDCSATRFMQEKPIRKAETPE